MGGLRKARNCNCQLCGEEGKLIEEHEWKEHRRQLRILSRQSSLQNRHSETVAVDHTRLMFGLAVNDQIGRDGSASDSLLWGPAESQEETQNLSTGMSIDGLDFDPDVLVSALSTTGRLSSPADKRQSLFVIVREKKDALQRKMERALSHISHKRNMNRLNVVQGALNSLSTRFDLQEKGEISMEIDELESGLASISLNTTSVKGKTSPVKKWREELLDKIDKLADRFQKWRLENDLLKPEQTPTFDMSKCREICVCRS